MRYTECGRVRWAGRGGAGSLGLKDLLLLTFSGSGLELLAVPVGSVLVAAVAAGLVTTESGFNDSLFTLNDDSLFSFRPNLNAQFLTSGDENIGGLLAEADPGVGGLRTLPGDSGWGEDTCCFSSGGGKSKSENLLGLLSTVSSEIDAKHDIHFQII